jgi:hypothetical protein
MNRTQKILLIICLVGSLLRIGPALALGDEVDALPGIHDQISYHTLSIRLIERHGFTFGQPWWPATRAGEPTAHWSYLYTAYLVITYKIFGTHPLAARILQSVMAGLLMPWLTFRLTRRTFRTNNGTADSIKNSEIIALIAAVWSACYPYFLYYASALMTETFFLLGVLWILDTSQRIADSNHEREGSSRFGIWVLLGLSIGVTALLRQVILMWVPFLCLWLIWASNHTCKQAKRTWQTITGILVSGVIAFTMILPFTLYNYQRFGRFVFLNTNAGYAFFWANHPIYGNRFIPILTSDQPSYQELIPTELLKLDEAALDQALLKEGITFVISDPVRYIRLSISRLPVYFQFWPSSGSSLPSNLTRVFSFGLALPFMLLGVLFWFRNVKDHRFVSISGSLLLLFAVIYSLIHLLSWSLIRYRLPVDAVMLIFAANSLAIMLRRFGVWTWLLSKVYIENPLPGPLRTNFN